MSGKGDKRRPSEIPSNKYRDEYDRIFFKRSAENKEKKKIT